MLWWRLHLLPLRKKETMKTADLERSKRLKELGWEQRDSAFYFIWNNQDGSHDFIYHDKLPCNYKEIKLNEDDYSAPTAGEMIEWLLGKGWSIEISKNGCLSINLIDYKNLITNHFEIKNENICNALADACAWVMERKK